MASSEYTITKAASGDLEVCEKIMREIYTENPRHWPYGLSTDQLRGNLYMVRQASTNDPVGFVGWQEAREGHRKVGYYSIGILPEYRKQGFAKSAVQQIITEKSAGVDEVRALIHITNAPSLQLADSLAVPIEKIANFSRGERAVLGGVGGAALYPAIMQLLRLDDGPTGEWAQTRHHGASALRGGMIGSLLGLSQPDAEEKPEEQPQQKTEKEANTGNKFTALQRAFNVGVPLTTGGALAYGWDQAGYGGEEEWGSARVMNLLKNFGVGVLAGKTALPGYKMPKGGGPATLTAPSAKNVSLGVTEGLVLPPLLNTFVEAPGAVAKYKAGTPDNLGKMLMGLLPALGAGGLGLAAYNAFKKEDPQQITINQPPPPGRIRVTLPTKNPGDQETQVDLPFDADALQLSHNIQGTLSRDVRRRLLDEAKHRRVRKGTRRLNTASDPARLRILE